MIEIINLNTFQRYASEIVLSAKSKRKKQKASNDKKKNKQKKQKAGNNKKQNIENNKQKQKVSNNN